MVTIPARGRAQLGNRLLDALPLPDRRRIAALLEREKGGHKQILYLWVPKTFVTWADALQIAVGPAPRSGVGRAGLGLSGDAMIFGLWA
jgi:hypothetical protein